MPIMCLIKDVELPLFRGGWQMKDMLMQRVFIENLQWDTQQRHKERPPWSVDDHQYKASDEGKDHWRDRLMAHHDLHARWELDCL